MSDDFDPDLLHPDLRAELPLVVTTKLSDDILPALREARRAACLPIAPVPGVMVEERPAEGDLPRRLIYRPEGVEGPLPAILHCHGGGLVIGMPEASHLRNAGWAADLGAVVVSVDYGKAPERPFPAGAEDAFAAWTWLHAAAAEVGVDPARCAIAGESAGGCIAATLALMIRARGAPAARLMALLYPMLDDRTAADESYPHRHLVWTAASNRFGWSRYLGQPPGLTEVPELSVPGRVEDLSGLPPAWIGVGSIDLFAAEDIAFAGRLLADGVPVELHVWPGVFHAWQRSSPDAPVTAEIEGSSRAALMRALRAG